MYSARDFTITGAYGRKRHGACRKASSELRNCYKPDMHGCFFNCIWNCYTPDNVRFPLYKADRMLFSTAQGTVTHQTGSCLCGCGNRSSDVLFHWMMNYDVMCQAERMLHAGIVVTVNGGVQENLIFLKIWTRSILCVCWVTHVKWDTLRHWM